MQFKHGAHPLANEVNFVTSLPNYRKHPIALPAGESPSRLLAYVWGLSKLDQPVDGLVSFPSATCYGGILDSPLVMHKSWAPLSLPHATHVDPGLATNRHPSQCRTCRVIFILMSLALLSPSTSSENEYPQPSHPCRCSRRLHPHYRPTAIIELAFQVLPLCFPKSTTDHRPRMKPQPFLVYHTYNNKCGSSCACSCNPGSL